MNISLILNGMAVLQELGYRDICSEVSIRIFTKQGKQVEASSLFNFTPSKNNGLYFKTQ